MPNPGLIRMGQSPKNRIARALGESLGKGIGEFTSTYAANKDLDKALEDPNYKDAPLSERASILERAMSKHGEKGAGILQKRLGIEQQAEQEFVSGLIPKLQKGEELTPQELKRLPVDVQQEAAKIKEKNKEQEILREFIEKRKKLNAPISSTPRSGRVGNDLRFNLEDEPNQSETPTEEKPWTPEEIEVMTVTNPTIANSMRAQNKEIDDRKREKIKQDLEQDKFDFTQKKEGATFNKDYQNQVLMGYDQYKANKARYEELDRLSTKGELPKPALVAALEKLGIPLGVLENADAEAFQKLSLDLTTGINDDYRGRILEKEFATFLERIPQLSNSREGRKQIVENLKLLNELKRINYDAYRSVKSKYKGKALPFDFQDEIYDEKEKAVDEWSKNFISRMGRYSVAPGTPLNQDVIDRYSAIADTPEEAARMAKEDGYEF